MSAGRGGCGGATQSRMVSLIAHASEVHVDAARPPLLKLHQLQAASLAPLLERPGAGETRDSEFVVQLQIAEAKGGGCVEQAPLPTQFVIHVHDNKSSSKKISSKEIIGVLAKVSHNRLFY